MATTFPDAPHTAESIIARARATRDASTLPDWTGTCPVCGERRLHVQAWSSGEGAVFCGSAGPADCDVEDLADALGVDHARIREAGVYTGEDGERVTMAELRITHGMTLMHETPDDAGPGAADEDAAFLARFLGRDALATLPQPEPLIEDTLDRRTLVMLGGQYGVGKSFVALDWALCIATGTRWNGRDVQRGRVLYVTGEGATGVHQRVSAWETHHGVTVEDDAFMVLPDAVQIAAPKEGAGNEALRRVERAVHVLAPDLVIFDTLARMTVGLNENSSEDMGRFVEGLERIKRAHDGVSVLTVHHAGKGDRADLRGSSALGGAMDTVYQAVSAGDGLMKLTRMKRKDGPQFDEWHLALTPVEGTDSVVLLPGERPRGDAGDNLAVLIEQHLLSHGPQSMTQIRNAVPGKADRISATIALMTQPDPTTGDPGSVLYAETLTKAGTSYLSLFISLVREFRAV